jgi:lactate dehydrogenase-like 2-hydroxyacid dehydrogenase
MTAPPTVVVTYPGFDAADARTAGALREHGIDVRFEPRTGERSTQEVARLMAGAIGGIISTDPFDGSVFAGCPALRVLARVGVGIDTVDVDAATDAGVAVTITPGVNTATVADHTLALILACCRRLIENDRRTRSGAWDRGGALNGGDLTGATVGIVGLGEIGRAVAHRLRGFDVTLLGSDLPGVECELVERVELDDLLRRSDIVTLHVPLTGATRGLIGARELELMADDAILVNTSRGGIVDEAALIPHLRSGRLGAGLDVFESEPPRSSPMLEVERAVITPHIAGISVRTQQAMLEMAVESVLDVVAGRVPAGLVNPQALRGPRERVA